MSHGQVEVLSGSIVFFGVIFIVACLCLISISTALYKIAKELQDLNSNEISIGLDSISAELRWLNEMKQAEKREEGQLLVVQAKQRVAENTKIINDLKQHCKIKA